jgi:hypothetical protein
MSSGARNGIHRYHIDSMASYWIVVPRGNPELFELLSVAFEGRAGFAVIIDRRQPGDVSIDERRAVRVPLSQDEFIVAEQAERASDERAHRHTGHRLPVRRRRARRPIARSSTPHDRLFTL